jgi:predicted AlkP superfamily pyrophosphatase or phosphodiesterase
MMRAMRWLWVLAVTACGPRGAQEPAAAAAPKPRVVMISIDGLMPEAYRDPDALGLQVPTLRSLVKRGASARTVEPVFPSVTYPAHTTMVTGVPPSVHGITTNRPPDPANKNQEGWRWYSEDIAVPTLWQAVEAQHRRAALVTWPVTVGARASIVVPEYWRAGTPDDQKLERALSTPGFLARVAGEDPRLWQAFVPPDVKDAAQFAIATYIAKHEPFDLLLVHAWQLDDAQHDHGPRSTEAKAAIENADRLIGELLAVLERDPAWSRTYVLVVSDHGFAPYEHEIRPYVPLAALPAASSANGGVCYVYVLDPAAREAIAAAVASIPHVARTLARSQIAALGGDPDAEYALVSEPGYAFSETRTAPVVAETPPKGHHGWPPSDPAMAASLIAIGPGIAPQDLGAIRMLDIAPTVARLLDVPLPTAVGTPLAIVRH